MKYLNWLMHFNPNHDPKTGRFTDEHGRFVGVSERTQPSASANRQLTKAEKDRLRKITISAMAAVGIGAAVYIAYKAHAIDKISNLLKSGVTDKSKYRDAMYESLDDETQVLKAGTVLHRMEGFAGRDVTIQNNPAFVSFTEKDRATYMTLLKDFHGTNQRYDVSYETLKDLRIPTREKAEQIFNDLFHSDPQLKSQMNQQTVQILKKANPFLAGYKDEDILRLGARFPSSFDQMVFNFANGGEASEKFRNSILQNGFDAIEDYHDKGVLSNFPLIVLDPRSSIRKTGEQFVTKALKQETLQNCIVRGHSIIEVQNPMTGGMNALRIEDLIKRVTEDVGGLA